MKKYLMTLVFINLFQTTIYSQEKAVLDRNSILKLFKTFEPLKAQDSILNTNYYNLDYKALYYDLELKSYFLKCLDQKAFFEIKMNEEIESYKKIISNPVRLNDEIKSYLYERKRDKQIDSILKDQQLIKKLKDSVIANEILFKKKVRNFKNYLPPINLLVKLKYLEVYKTIKQWSIENSQHNFFKEKLSFNDPESQIEFDKRVTNYVNANGKNESYRYFLDVIREINTAYGYSKLLDLVAVNKVEITMQAPVFNVDGVVVDTDNSESPVNFLLLGSVNLLHWVNYYKLPYENLIIQNELLLGSDTRKQNEFIEKNLPEIKKALLDIVKIKAKEEEYWMKNMPFYKKK
jgi:hypothetical protein